MTLKNDTPVGRLFLQAAIEKVPGFTIDDDNRDIINQVCFYISKTPRFEFTDPETQNRTGKYLGRGLMLAGNPGCGKTDLVSILQRCFNKIRDARTFRKISMIDFSRMYGKKDEQGNVIDMLTRYKGKHLFIDEFGMIDEKTGLRKYEVKKDFGSDVDLGEMIILQRYNEFKEGWLTHITTNITPEQLKQQYDSRTVSRIYEMCNIFSVIGPDRRKTAIPRTDLAPVPAPEEKSSFLDLLNWVQDQGKEGEKIYQSLVTELNKVTARVILNSEKKWNESDRPKLTQESHLEEFTAALCSPTMPELKRLLKQAELKQNRELTALIENEITNREKKAA